ncbi:MAG: glycerate kinase [Pseudomonadota bacterium]
MNFQRIFVPIAVIASVVVAYRFYGWQGVAGVVSMLVFWVLLNFNRMMQVLKRAANRPIGYVDSAVMLNAKLKPGMTLMHVIAMTKALGKLMSVKDEQPEVFTWTDNSDSIVTATFVAGKLSHHELFRPSPDDAPVPVADIAPPAPPAP